MAHGDQHLVQFYGADERLLAANVCRFTAYALERGGAAGFLATREHGTAFLEGLKGMGLGPIGALGEGRLVVMDAHEALWQIMHGGRPDRAAFDELVGGMLAALSAAARGGPVRVYAELVGILWEAGQPMDAIRLENLCNSIRLTAQFDLLCGYPIDIFSEDFQCDGIGELFRTHTELVSGGSRDGMVTALNRAIGEVLGDRAGSIRPAALGQPRASWAKMPEPEAKILWLREHLPSDADRVLAKAKSYYAERSN